MDYQLLQHHHGKVATESHSYNWWLFYSGTAVLQSHIFGHARVATTLLFNVLFQQTIAPAAYNRNISSFRKCKLNFQPVLIQTYSVYFALIKPNYVMSLLLCVYSNLALTTNTVSLKSNIIDLSNRKLTDFVCVCSRKLC